MKLCFFSILIAIAFLTLPSLAQDTAAHSDETDRPIRIACVGDSITYGAMIPERERWCYPALLQDMLGEGYDVRNFGVNAATLLSEGDIPYIEQQAYQDALAFEPDVVVIMLGTNDTKAHNWQHVDAFEEDYAALVDSFRELASEPRIVSMVPVPAWTEGDGIDGGRVREGVVPRVSALAVELRCERIDLFTAMIDKQSWFPDGVHPNSFGAEYIAMRVYEAAVGGAEPDPAPVNFATVARPSVEHRGNPAGWGGGTWWNQHEAINALGEANDDIDIVFLGDSITQSFTGVGDRLGHAGGNRTFDQYFGDLNAAGFGISGDRTEHLLYRITNGNFDHIAPKVVVLMIGVNNFITGGNTGEETAEGTRAVVAALREHEPQAHVIVLGCFPSGRTIDSPNRLKSNALHEEIAGIGDEDAEVTYMDLRPLFLNADGTPNNRMRGDAIHVTGSGYEAWAEAIEPVIQKLLAE